MAGEWVTTTLGDACSLITDGAHFSPAEDPEGWPMASVKDLTRHDIDLLRCKRISAVDFEMLRRQGCMPKPGDVLIAKDGASALDTVCVHRSTDEVVLLSSVAILRPTRQVDPDFLRYYLDSPLTRSALKAGFRSGSAIPRVVLRDFRQAPVTLPPLPEQRAIAQILGSLDDKIELNRRMNETLEATARALFKSWFVDFDPVRAKTEGRFPGVPKPLSDLFPDRFEGSVLGEIPAGWGVGSIGEHAHCVRGRSYGSDDLRGSATALVTLKSFERGGGYRVDGLKPYTGAFNLDQVVRPGELIVACTDVTQAAEVIGKPAMVQSSDEFATLVASLDVLIVRSRDPLLSVPFLYCLFRTDQFSQHTYARSTGTTVLHLSNEAVPSYRLALPSAGVADAFARLTEPVFKRVDQSTRESRSLTLLRDTLLPKLISGGLRVPQTERMLEAAPL